MDENEYHSMRTDLVTTQCVFEKSILALKTQCKKSTKKNIAEREVVLCTADHFAERCNVWLVLLREKSQFSLHISEQIAVLPHAKEMKVQAGGMLGLCKVLEMDCSESDIPSNVFEILEACEEQVSDFERLPFAEIIREIVHFRIRR